MVKIRQGVETAKKAGKDRRLPSDPSPGAGLVHDRNSLGKAPRGNGAVGEPDEFHADRAELFHDLEDHLSHARHVF